MTRHVTRIRARLTLQAHRRVLGLLEGEYAATLTGRGMELNDLREYVRGDDPKDIDWKASARHGDLLVKRFVAQRRHTVVLVVSTGRGMAAAATLEESKRDRAVEVAGIVGWLAVRQGDRVGAVSGSAAGHHVLPPGAGEAHLERALSAAYDAVSASGPEADLPALLRQVAQQVRRRAIVLVVADDDEATPELEAALRRLVVQHELLMVTIGDLDPAAVPAGAPRSVDVTEDVSKDTGLPAWVRGDPLLMAELADDRTGRLARWQSRMADLGVVHEHLDESSTTLSAVRRLLERNKHARRR
ncbi:DUF58 domain-containing protein [Nocardioides dilutus]